MNSVLSFFIVHNMHNKASNRVDWSELELIIVLITGLNTFFNGEHLRRYE
jgi:hypothetical protein